MHKQKEQILFKCHLQHQKPEYEDINTFNINKIIEANKSESIFELILDNCKFIMDFNFSIQISQQFIVKNIQYDQNRKFKVYYDYYRLQSLIYLGLNNCNIVTLQNIPKIDSLKRLTLDYNFIKNSELIHLKFYQNKLLSLSIMQNQLDFSDQSLLQEFYRLIFRLNYIYLINYNQNQQIYTIIQLSIAGNQKDVTEYESVIVRNEIFKNMKNLVFLDTIAKGEYLSTCMENQFSDQKQEQEYLSRLDVVDWKTEQEYKQVDQ